MIRQLVDLIYRVGAAKSRFEAANPSEAVRFAIASKAVWLDVPRPLERGPHWVMARRTTLIFTPDRLVCGDWEVRWSEVRRAQQLVVSSLTGGEVLLLDTDRGQLQAGVSGTIPADALPVEVEHGTGRIGTSPFSLVVRLILVAWLGYEAVKYLVSVFA